MSRAIALRYSTTSRVNGIVPLYVVAVPGTADCNTEVKINYFRTCHPISRAQQVCCPKRYQMIHALYRVSTSFVTTASPMTPYEGL
jgi:hypothetical protein